MIAGCLYAWMYPPEEVEEVFLRCCISYHRWDRWCSGCKNIYRDLWLDEQAADPRTCHEVWLSDEEWF